MEDTELTNPPPLTNAVCMHCGYDISGLQPNEHGLVTCPECGYQLRYNRTTEVLTPKLLHSTLAKRLLLPTVLVPSIAMLCACVPVLNVLGAFVMLATMLALTCHRWVSTVPDLIQTAKLRPQYISQSHVIGWSILYLLPQIAIAYAYTRIASLYAITV